MCWDFVVFFLGGVGAGEREASSSWDANRVIQVSWMFHIQWIDLRNHEDHEVLRMMHTAP